MKNKIGNILKAGMTVKTLSVFLTVSLLLTAVPVLVGADTAGDKITESFSFTFSEPMAMHIYL